MSYSLDFDYSKIFTKDILETRSNIDEFLHIVTDVDENPKSIHAFLPKLCSAVFGSREKRGWLHRRLTRQEEKAIYDLLRPSSRLFKAIVRFHTERNLLYEILPDRLPRSIQNSLTSNSYDTLPNYYRGKVQFADSNLNQTNSSLSGNVKNDGVKLMFNMLEYYLFCFCYVMTVDFPNQGTSQWSKPAVMPETNDMYSLHNNVGSFPQTMDNNAQYQHNMQAQNVYIELLHGYMEYFIPYGPQKEKTQRDGEKIQRPSYNIFTDSNVNFSGMKNVESSLALSEFFVGTVSELWFKYSERFEGTRGRRASFSSINQRPSVDLLQCISDFINHLIGADLRFSFAPTEGKLWDSDDGEFYLLVKKTAYHTLHPHLYQFLKSSMSWWLLDDTFTNIVDIWLNYISPWGSTGPADKDKVLSKDWIPFILDNFLFYTEIFRRFLERAADLEIAEPVDLDGDRKYYGAHPSQGVIAKLSPKSNVRMIRRVLKLFRTIGLHEYLRGIELFIMSPDYASSYPTNLYRHQNSQFPQADPLAQFGLDSKLLSMYGATVRQHINNLEGPQFEYKPIFHDSTKDTIKILIAKITVALEKRNKILNPEAQPAHHESQSLYHKIFDFTKKAVQGNDEEAWKGSLVRQKARLETILRLIGELFDITDKDWQDLNLSPSLANLQITPGVQTPEFFSEDPTHLTQRGRTQVKLGLRKCSKYDVPIIGDRGDLIVRSYESATLVDLTRWLDMHADHYYKELIRYLIEQKQIQVPQSLRTFPFSFRFFAAYPNLLFLFISWLFYRIFCFIFF
ncbi:sphingomyelin phosphodiesterase 4, neutral membrane (neutral sphingomyelinase-3) [Basidiobolus ranarum]|uniref:Sphingomyelin phosphodiesterase 4, neutral membrane (Neutral sphingomyelinase-3) n=1 Tax=Basidiobolus ranarum TaxID=34480 RepID=A0ABR2WU06_9FUNG